jgi:hypothetical protein
MAAVSPADSSASRLCAAVNPEPTAVEHRALPAAGFGVQPGDLRRWQEAAVGVQIRRSG